MLIQILIIYCDIFSRKLFELLLERKPFFSSFILKIVFRLTK